MAENREIFFKASFIRPPKICNRQLQPFSLCHEYFLSYIGNPYLVGGKVTTDDLLSAILVCSKTYNELKTHLYYPVSFLNRLWFLRWKYRNLDIAHESFKTYMDDYFDTPDHFRKMSDDVEIPDRYKAPWEYHAVRVLCEVYNMTVDEAWNTSINLARCYYDTWAESNGDDSIIGDRLNEEESAENESKLWKLVTIQQEELKKAK